MYILVIFDDIRKGKRDFVVLYLLLFGELVQWVQARPFPPPPSPYFCI